MDYALAILIGYLLGSVPVAIIVARRHGVDLYRTADGNPGAWNALEQLGARRAWPAFVGDGLKGFVAAATGLLVGDIWVAYAAAAAAMVGHALPAFARLRGGKSVMTFAGAIFALAPVAAGLALAACLAVAAARRAFGPGARVGIFAFPFIQLAVDDVQRVAATGGLMTLIGLLFLLRRGDRSQPARSDTSDPATSD